MLLVPKQRTLHRFSEFLATDVEPALSDGDEQLRQDLYSVQLVLELMAVERERIPETVEEKRSSLVESLDEVERVAESTDADATPVVETVEEVQRRLENQQPTTRVSEVDRQCSEFAGQVLAAIDELPESDARALRTPLYGFLAVDVEMNLESIDHGSVLTEVTETGGVEDADD